MPLRDVITAFPDDARGEGRGIVVRSGTMAQGRGPRAHHAACIRC